MVEEVALICLNDGLFLASRWCLPPSGTFFESLMRSVEAYKLNALQSVTTPLEMPWITRISEHRLW